MRRIVKARAQRRNANATEAANASPDARWRDGMLSGRLARPGGLPRRIV